MLNHVRATFVTCVTRVAVELSASQICNKWLHIIGSIEDGSSAYRLLVIHTTFEFHIVTIVHLSMWWHLKELSSETPSLRIAHHILLTSSLMRPLHNPVIYSLHKTYRAPQ